MLKVAVITDIHNGPDRGTKMGSAAPALLEQFVAFVKKKGPDLVIDLGDRISQVSHEDDYSAMRQVAGYFAQIAQPRIHIMGNHDVDFLVAKDSADILDQTTSSHVTVQNGITFVCWNARVNLDLATGLDLSDSDIAWLEKTIREISYPAVICTHVPLDNGSMAGNFYFDKRYPHHAHYPAEKAERVREMLERSGKFILCLNGHAHWNAYHCIDGIHYVTLPSLTETFVSYPDPHAAWTWMEIADGKIDIEIFGKTPMRYILPVRAENHHWVSKDKDYSPSATDPA